MGNQPSGAHGHSHNGKPCHGHGGAQQQHGHSHGAQQQHGHSHGAQQPQHGHSHGGKPCHGHGGAPAPAPTPQHGHSHGGKPCHGHGGAQQQHGHSHGAQQQHGHSHGAQQPQHGHSHGGKPCHGHGGAQQPVQAPVPTTPEEVEMLKKQRGVQLFMTQMFVPKIPIVWAFFHENPKRVTADPPVMSSGMLVPSVEGEIMNRDEFREFISAFIGAQARHEGHGVVRVIEAFQMEQQLLMQLGFKDAVTDPELSIQLPYAQFMSLVSQFVMVIAMKKYDAMALTMDALGLGAMKLPKLPQTSEEVDMQRIAGYSRDKIMPLLIKFVDDNAEAKADDTNAAIASGFVACTGSIKYGIDEYINFVKTVLLKTPEDDVTPPTPEALHERWLQHANQHMDVQSTVVGISEEIENLQTQAMAHPDEVLGELKVHPSDSTFSSALIANNVQKLVIIPLLDQNPVALKYIAKQWSIDLQIEMEEDEKPADQKAQ